MEIEGEQRKEGAQSHVVLCIFDQLSQSPNNVRHILPTSATRLNFFMTLGRDGALGLLDL